MKNQNFLTKIGLAILPVMLVWGCSSGVKKADIPSTANPQEELAKFNADLTQAVAQNVDVLSASDYDRALARRDDAKEDLAKGKKQEKVLDDLRMGRGYLNRAYETAGDRASKTPPLFESRQAAMKAGVRNHPELRRELQSVDSTVSRKSEKLSDLSTNELSDLQSRYMDLEKRSVILNEIGSAQAMVNGAREDGARRKAPETFKKAEISVKNAESVISTNVRNPNGYKLAVSEAKSDASLLNDVMTTIRQNKDLSETAALQMVNQNRQIKDLQTNMTESAASVAAAEAALRERNEKLAAELAAKEKDLGTARSRVEIQQALEKARASFSPNEAEAYQQGDSLVIRMKNMNFASGRSDLPAASLASLAKVSEVAKSLNASKIDVEGHTDSSGSAAKNETLSEKRAEAVASYLKTSGFGQIDVESQGFGFKKPIASNKTKEGRAQNRRVDIVITPNKEGATQVE